MSLYRKLSVRIYGDSKFRSLSAPPPNGQTLFIYLITSEFTGPIPGVVKAGEAAIAEALGWPLKGFRAAFRELEEQGMARADWAARLIFLPNGIRHNKADNPSVAEGWGKAFYDLPECALANDIHQAICAFLTTLGPEFLNAFMNPRARSAKPFARRSDTPSGTPCSTLCQGPSEDGPPHRNSTSTRNRSVKEKESEEEEEERALPARTHTADTQVNNPDPTAPPKGDKPPSAGKNSGEKNRSGKVPWPDDFTLTEARRQVAIKHDRDPDREWECFHAHALMNRATRVDWPQAWVYWCTNGIGRDIRGRAANHGPPSKIEQFKDPLADIRISDEERERNAGKFREMLARGTTKHL